MSVTTRSSTCELISPAALALSYEGQIYPGEHSGIVAADVFQRVQQTLLQHGRSGGKGPRPRKGGILSGLVRCQACGCAMTHTYSCRRQKRYRYYVCLQAQKRGYHVCPAPTVPADELERFVVDQIRAIGRDAGVLAATWAEVTRKRGEERRTRELESESLTTQISAAYGELSRASIRADSESRVADLQEQIARQQRRLGEIQRDLRADDQDGATEEDVQRALKQFDPLWEVLSPSEQNRLLRSLIDRVEIDARSGEIELTFQPHAFGALGQSTDSDENQP